MNITSASHLDHSLTAAQIAWIAERFAQRDAFFIESVVLPPSLGTVPCGLHGPKMGDDPIIDAECILVKRNERAWESRLCDRVTRPTSTVTVIAGPHGDDACVLYTAFGGPLAPQEPGDPSCKDVDVSRAFWSEHALSL